MLHILDKICVLLDSFEPFTQCQLGVPLPLFDEEQLAQPHFTTSQLAVLVPETPWLDDAGPSSGMHIQKKKKTQKDYYIGCCCDVLFVL